MSKKILKILYHPKLIKYYCPLIITIFSTAIIFLIAYLISSNFYFGLLIAFISSIVCFFISIPVTDHLLTYEILGESFKIFLEEMRGSNQAIRHFCKFIIYDFFSDEGSFRRELLGSNELSSITFFIKKIKGSGIPLENEIYAQLLKSSAELDTFFLYAAWIDVVFKVEGEVFIRDELTESIKVNEERYGFYFATLEDIYKDIKPHNKNRVFVLESKDFNSIIINNNFEKNPFWKECLKYHNNWGFQELAFMEQNKYYSMAKGLKFVVKDFVLFKSHSYPSWIVGMNVPLSINNERSRSAFPVRIIDKNIKKYDKFLSNIKKRDYPSVCILSNQQGKWEVKKNGSANY